MAHTLSEQLPFSPITGTELCATLCNYYSDSNGNRSGGGDGVTFSNVGVRVSKFSFATSMEYGAGPRNRLGEPDPGSASLMERVWKEMKWNMSKKYLPRTRRAFQMGLTSVYSVPVRGFFWQADLSSPHADTWPSGTLQNQVMITNSITIPHTCKMQEEFLKEQL